LLPGEEAVGVDVKGVKHRVREHLRKNGVGRRLYVVKMGENKGSVALMLPESIVEDEI
jgi:hypothetical protein